MLTVWKDKGERSPAPGGTETRNQENQIPPNEPEHIFLKFQELITTLTDLDETAKSLKPVLQAMQDTLHVQKARLDAHDHLLDLVRRDAKDTRSHASPSFVETTNYMIDRINQHNAQEIKRIGDQLNVVSHLLDELSDRYDKHRHLKLSDTSEQYTDTSTK